MKKIGILYGHESTLPSSLIARINDSGQDGICAESVQVGAVETGALPIYRVLLDRVSHDVPFYRTFLKTAALSGTTVLNDPFWSTADDRFFQYGLAQRLGVATPRAVLLPHKQHPHNVTEGALRNLTYPLDWDSIFRFVGFPAYLKPVSGCGHRLVRRIHDAEEFFHAYHQTGDRCMTLQAAVETDLYLRCFVVDGAVRLMHYDPRRPPAERYLSAAPPLAPDLERRLVETCRLLHGAVGYAINRIELAVVGDEIQVVDFLNPAPDIELERVGLDHFVWFVDSLTGLLLRAAAAPPTPPTPCGKALPGN